MNDQPMSEDYEMAGEGLAYFTQRPHPRFKDIGALIAYRYRRFSIAYDLREQGLTLRAVGDKLGVSASRARQMICGHKRLLAKRARLGKSSQ